METKPFTPVLRLVMQASIIATNETNAVNMYVEIKRFLDSYHSPFTISGSTIKILDPCCGKPIERN